MPFRFQMKHLLSKFSYLVVGYFHVERFYVKVLYDLDVISIASYQF
jgi:hypothetical protein